MAHTVEEADIHFIGLVGQQAAGDFNPGGRKARHAIAGNQRIGVFHRRHHASKSFPHQRVRAGRRAAVVAAWLQCDVGSGAAYIVAAALGVFQRLDFGMVLASGLRHAFADHHAVTHNDAADTRIRGGGEQPFFRPLQGEPHAFEVTVDIHMLAQVAGSRTGSHKRALPCILILILRCAPASSRVMVPKLAAFGWAERQLVPAALYEI